MTENIDEDNAILNLFHDELISQVREYKHHLLSYLSDRHGDTIDQLLRIVHSIKGAAKLVNQDNISLISDSLEGYFKSLHDGKVVVDEYQEKILKKSLSILEDIAASPKNEFKVTIDIFKNSLNNVVLELKKISDKPHKENNSKSIPSTKKVDANQGLNENDKKIMLNDLGVYAEILAKGIALIKADSVDECTIDDMQSATNKVIQIGESMSLGIVEELGNALGNCLNAASKNQLVWTRGHLDLLVESVDFLKRLSDCEISSISTWLDKHVNNADAIASVLLAISREAASIPAKHPTATVQPNRNVEKPTDTSTSSGFTIDANMLDLFNTELDQRVRELNEGLLALEGQFDDPGILDGLMRAAHSIKGAARIVELSQVSRLAHSLEDFFVYLQEQELKVSGEYIDQLLVGVDFFERLAQVPHNIVNEWLKNNSEKIEHYIAKLADLPEDIKLGKSNITELTNYEDNTHHIQEQESPKASDETVRSVPPQKTKTKQNISVSSSDPFLRVSSNILNRLMGLAGESLVEARWLTPYLESMVIFKRAHGKIGHRLVKLGEALDVSSADEKVQTLLQSLKEEIAECQIRLTEKITDLELFMQRQTSLSDRLYTEVISTRMRPFNDGIEGFPRFVRELSKQLNKKANLVIDGKNTPVDREILQKLEAPLNHLIRNAIDHGIESPSERSKKGKSETGTIKIEVAHRAGMLSITVSDDGRGVDLTSLKKKVIEKGFVSQAMAEQLSDGELLEFMFLPGFSTSKELTELSGRGIGLNVVQNMVHEVGGTLKAQLDEGLSFHLQLPLTLSVIRALLIEISGEPYALPLARLKRVLYLPKEEIHVIEHRQYFHDNNVNVGLISAQQFLGLDIPHQYDDLLSVIVISDGMNDYGVIVDKFLGEKELVVQELPNELGKVPDISGGAFMENGSPILIIDVEDMVRSIDKQLSKGDCESIDFSSDDNLIDIKRKRILVVDDSITVREVECRLLENNGYNVDTAINGVDGWNAVRVGDYDLVITDVDMPRMNGIEFVKAIRGDDKFKDLPVVIVSYKERESDRVAGMEAGANFYLTKSSFHDETLLSAVSSLIGDID